MRWMVLSGFPLAVGLSLLSPEITAVLFPTYTPSEVGKIATALQWLSWAGGLIFVTTAVQAVLRATDKRRAFSVLMGATALLNICLNIYLIPRYSHVGAAKAMVMSEAFLLILGSATSQETLSNSEKPLLYSAHFESNLSLCSDGYRFGTVKGFSLHLGADSAGGAVLWWRNRHSGRIPVKT